MSEINELTAIVDRMKSRAEKFRGGRSLMISTGWDVAFDDLVALCQYVVKLEGRVAELERERDSDSAGN